MKKKNKDKKLLTTQKNKIKKEKQVSGYYFDGKRSKTLYEKRT